jgi:hypothetical protein
MQLKTSALLLALATALAGTSLNAATVRFAPIEELAAHSAVILHGVVRVIDEDLSTSKDGPFLTRVDLEVLTGVQGAEPGDVFAFTLLGGVAGSRRMVVPGMPRFEVGQEVVLLLERTPTGHIPTGLGQGVFDVSREGGVALARQRLSRGPHKAPDVALDELVLRLRRAARGGAR